MTGKLILKLTDKQERQVRKWKKKLSLEDRKKVNSLNIKFRKMHDSVIKLKNILEKK